MRRIHSFLMTTLDGFYEGPTRSSSSSPARTWPSSAAPTLTVSLLEVGLVDELRVMVNQVAVGDGKSLFRSSRQELPVKLLQTRTFRSGNVLLTYQPPRSPGAAT